MTHRQLPASGEIYLDHIGHFVGDAEAARAALEGAGFCVTPFSAQVAPTGPGGALELTGTGNVCAMLRAGYIEVLVQTADTPVGREFAASLAKRPGLHLAAFAVADAEREPARLAEAGFTPRPLVRMKRPVDTVSGPSEARFTVARIEAGAMPEGRIQVLTHHTEPEVWQERWLDQPNGVLSLLGVTVISSDPAEAAERFARFTGRPARVEGDRRIVALDRGEILIAPPAGAMGSDGSGDPLLVGYRLGVRDIGACREFLERAGLAVGEHEGALVTRFPPALGEGFWAFSQI